VLRWQAVRWALVGLALIVAPGTLVERWFSQPAVGDAAWLRALGVTSVVLAAQIVLVGRKLEELWWWTWSFAILEAGTGLIALAHVVLGLPAGAAAWPWWITAVVNLGFAALDVVGLARTGTERSPV
jgi:hypothetical protein